LSALGLFLGSRDTTTRWRAVDSDAGLFEDTATGSLYHRDNYGALGLLSVETPLPDLFAKTVTSSLPVGGVERHLTALWKGDGLVQLRVDFLFPTAVDIHPTDWVITDLQRVRDATGEETTPLTDKQVTFVKARSYLVDAKLRDEQGREWSLGRMGFDSCTWDSRPDVDYSWSCVQDFGVKAEVFARSTEIRGSSMGGFIAWLESLPAARRRLLIE
jgi:hypothetical protein